MSDSSSDGSLRIPRAMWHARVSVVVYAWFASTLVVALFRDHIDDAAWLGTHFLLLGAVTNAIFVWSWHFTGAILRVPDQADRGDEVLRLVLLNTGAGGVIIGASTSSIGVVVVSALFVVAAVALLARAILAGMRRALPSPYAFTAQAYVYALSMLVCGIVLGVVMEAVHFDDATKPRAVMAHVSFNLLGFVGMTILGTIVTLWPTMLRTRIAPNAARVAKRVLPFLAAATGTAAFGFGLDLPWLASAGLVVYLAGFLVTMWPMLVVVRVKPPTSFATRSALAGMLWLAATIALLAIAVVRWGIVPVHDHGAGFVVGAATGVLQVLLGCMSYLLPAMAAGGPAIVRLRNDYADRLAWPRLVATNAGVLLVVFAPDGGRAPGVLLMLVGFVWTAVTIVTTLPTPPAERVAAAEAARIARGELQG